MNTEYIRLAYERSIVTDARRYLTNKYLEGGGSRKEVLVCEEVPYSIREVPPEPVAEFIQRLEEEEKRLTEEMGKFDFRKQDAHRPLARKQTDPDAAVDRPPHRPAKKSGRARRKPGNPGSTPDGTG